MKLSEANYVGIANDFADLLPDDLNITDATVDDVDVDAAAKAITRSLTQAIERNVPLKTINFNGKMRPYYLHIF